MPDVVVHRVPLEMLASHRTRTFVSWLEELPFPLHVIDVQRHTTADLDDLTVTFRRPRHLPKIEVSKPTSPACTCSARSLFVHPESVSDMWHARACAYRRHRDSLRRRRSAADAFSRAVTEAVRAVQVPKLWGDLQTHAQSETRRRHERVLDGRAAPCSQAWRHESTGRLTRCNLPMRHGGSFHEFYDIEDPLQTLMWPT